MCNAETIAAISTAWGRGGIAIVRVSGPAAENIILSLFQPAQASFPLKSHYLTYGWVKDSRTDHVVDEVMCCLMRAPKSYTREDVAEFHCHGGTQAAGKILELCLDTGARLAEPGEFTKRAFLAGRIDLSQAEAVADLIAAHSRVETELAGRQLAGGLRETITSLRKTLLTMLAALEVALDYPDEQAELVSTREMVTIWELVSGKLEDLIRYGEEGRIFREGLSLAIVGRPNVGKSSLFNALLGTDRAIVAASPGTTRDYLEADAQIGGVAVRLVDTAGLEHEPMDSIEEEGQRRAREKLEQADLTLVVIDGSRALTAGDVRIVNMTEAEKTIVVVNKTDLGNIIAKEALGGITAGRGLSLVSAKTKDGIGRLRDIIRRFINPGNQQDLQIPELVPNARHRTHLRQARDILDSLIERAETPWPLELVAVDIRHILDTLGLITGETVDNELWEHIFSNFCLGK